MSSTPSRRTSPAPRQSRTPSLSRSPGSNYRSPPPGQSIEDNLSEGVRYYASLSNPIAAFISAHSLVSDKFTFVLAKPFERLEKRKITVFSTLSKTEQLALEKTVRSNFDEMISEMDLKDDEKFDFEYSPQTKHHLRVLTFVPRQEQRSVQQDSGHRTSRRSQTPSGSRRSSRSRSSVSTVRN